MLVQIIIARVCPIASMRIAQERWIPSAPPARGASALMISKDESASFAVARVILRRRFVVEIER